MDFNLFQMLDQATVWWATLSPDFVFLMLLPFAVGGISLLVNFCRQIRIAAKRASRRRLQSQTGLV